MNALSVALVAGGLGLTAAALVTASGEARPVPVRWLAAALAPVGILAALAGAIGLVVPGFWG